MLIQWLPPLQTPRCALDSWICRLSAANKGLLILERCNSAQVPSPRMSNAAVRHSRLQVQPALCRDTFPRDCRAGRDFAWERKCACC